MLDQLVAHGLVSCITWPVALLKLHVRLLGSPWSEIVYISSMATFILTLVVRRPPLGSLRIHSRVSKLRSGMVRRALRVVSYWWVEWRCGGWEVLIRCTCIEGWSGAYVPWPRFIFIMNLMSEKGGCWCWLLSPCTDDRFDGWVGGDFCDGCWSFLGEIKERNWFGDDGMQHIRTKKEPIQPIPLFVETIELLMRVCHLEFSIPYTLTHLIIIS